MRAVEIGTIGGNLSFLDGSQLHFAEYLDLRDGIDRIAFFFHYQSEDAALIFRPERYKDRYGYLRPVIRARVYKYLNCGDLKQGFARVRCPDCGHEYLLAFSCKGRYFCTSCHTKRAVAFAEWLNTTLLLPVPHRQTLSSLDDSYEQVTRRRTASSLPSVFSRFSV